MARHLFELREALAPPAHLALRVPPSSGLLRGSHGGGQVTVMACHGGLAQDLQQV